mgnify:CR=1 FL=1
MLFYAISFYIGMFSDADYKIRCFCGFVAGTLWMMIAFNVLHDGSHYGLSIRGDVNVWNSRIWCALGILELWNLVLSSNVYGHHSFTGVEHRDPDRLHFYPIARKDKRDQEVIGFFLDDFSMYYFHL